MTSFCGISDETNKNYQGTMEITGSASWSQTMYCNGERHGISKEFFGCQPRTYFEDSESYKNLVQVTYYKKDKPFGVAWRRLIGGAFLVGTLDQETEEFSGNSVIYLYPDLINGIQGQFEDSKLISGYNCVVEETEYNKESGMLVPIVSVAKTGTSFDKVIERDVSTNLRISKTPLLPDTLESSRVEVRASLVKTADGLEAGEGLFSKTKILNGHIVALFNGVRQKSDEKSSDYRIKLNGDTDIDIPDEYTHIKNYCATLGHKANHSFVPNAR